MLLVGLLPGYLICQAQNVQNKEDVPLDLGYRVLPMGDYNGSAYTISGKQLRNLPVTNLSAVLAGLVPGYFARQVQGGGLVNEQNSFWIRGQRSNSPDVLVLVDGQERDFCCFVITRSRINYRIERCCSNSLIWNACRQWSYSGYNS